MAVEKNIRTIQEQIKDKNVTLICVTKSRSIEDIEQAIDSGIQIIAENRINEAEKKYDSLKDCLRRRNVEFHFIGRLQSNKVKRAVYIFDVIQTVHSLKLAEEIDKRAKEMNKTQRVFIEVNIGKEHQKTGTLPEEAINLLDEITKLKNIRLEGLMCIPPYSDNPEYSRKYFRKMKKLFDISKLKYLSMGMTEDYQIAIQEGSNMIRIGRGIFKN